MKKNLTKGKRKKVKRPTCSVCDTATNDLVSLGSRLVCHECCKEAVDMSFPVPVPPICSG